VTLKKNTWRRYVKKMSKNQEAWVTMQLENAKRIHILRCKVWDLEEELNKERNKNGEKKKDNRGVNGI
jgi:hypothetical protein